MSGSSLCYKYLIFKYYAIICTNCKRSVARRVRVLLTPETVDDACIYIKIIKHVRICYYIFYLSMLLVEKEQYNSCCFCCNKKKKLQCSGLTTKHSNSFVIVFIVWRQFFFGFVLFCFCETSFDVFTIFSELSRLKRNVLFMEIYIPMKSSILCVTKYAI